MYDQLSFLVLSSMQNTEPNWFLGRMILLECGARAGDSFMFRPSLKSYVLVQIPLINVLSLITC